ncbi:interleukin 17-like protein [Elysia marginata]|uniref:Interleukin 17-like protein n=1 Tax=Elysia marginata TaxID=1093978 RepID=A0AAV4G791_9GAST|nr:interleukin 17-like protein [Elysia marginata]
MPLKRHLHGVGKSCIRLKVHSQRSSESSTCPWIIRTHRDYFRIPHSIRYVQCKCKNCSHQYVHGGLCKEVMWEFSVLIKECTADGTFSFKRVFQRFPVACVCVPRLPSPILYKRRLTH